MKTFEEELKEIIDLHTGYTEDQKALLASKILAAHQAEMDRVVAKSIGKQTCTGDCISPYKLELKPSLISHSHTCPKILISHSHTCLKVRDRVKKQRARYKVIRNK